MAHHKKIHESSMEPKGGYRIVSHRVLSPRFHPAPSVAFIKQCLSLRAQTPELSVAGPFRRARTCKLAGGVMGVFAHAPGSPAIRAPAVRLRCEATQAPLCSVPACFLFSIFFPVVARGCEWVGVEYNPHRRLAPEICASVCVLPVFPLSLIHI